MPQLYFFASIAFGFIAWGMVAQHYILPMTRYLGRADALRPILILHSFRFAGLAFLVPGVVSSDLPPAFAHAAAYGDLLAAILALLTLASLPSVLGVGLAWLFNLWGTFDLQRLLSRQDLRASAGSAGRRVLYSDSRGTASADHTRARLPHSHQTST